MAFTNGQLIPIDPGGQVGQVSGITPPAPTVGGMPDTTPPATGLTPEMISAIRSGQQQRRLDNTAYQWDRAGISRPIGVQTGTAIEGLPPGFYNRVVDFSPQISSLQTQLAALGNPGDIGNLTSLLTATRNQMSPYQEAQSLQTQLTSLGENIADPASVQAQIEALKQQYAPLETIVGARQKLAELGNAYPQDSIAGLMGTISALEEQASVKLPVLQDPSQLPGGATPQQWNEFLEASEISARMQPQIEAAKAQLPALRMELSKYLQHNNAIESANLAINNLVAASGFSSPEEVNQAMGAYTAQQEGLKNLYDTAFKAETLGGKIKALTGGVNPTERLGQLQAELDQYDTQLGNAQKAQSLQSQIEGLRSATGGTEIIPASESPAPVLMSMSPARVEAVSQVDRTAGDSLAALDRALSNNQWSPSATSVLVDLAKSIRGDSALKDAALPALTQLVSQMKAQRLVPPSLSDQATPEAVAAAAKFSR